MLPRHLGSTALSRALRRGARRRTLSTHGLQDFTKIMYDGLGVADRLREVQEPMTAGLRERGWYVMDNVLSASTCAAMRAEAAALRDDDQFSQSYSQVAETGDKIWRPNVYQAELDGDSWRLAPRLVVYLSELMAALPPLMNSSFDNLMLSDGTMGHKLAVSEGDGARYPRHLDNVNGAPEDMRKLTAIYYMNTSACEEADGAAATAWDVERLGGAIRLYDGLEQPSHTDVAPVGDRLLVFWSDILVHEVLPSFADSDDEHRYTFTVWFVTHNAATLIDRRDPQYVLRAMYFPTREEQGV